MAGVEKRTGHILVMVVAGSAREGYPAALRVEAEEKARQMGGVLTQDEPVRLELPAHQDCPAMVGFRYRMVER